MNDGRCLAVIEDILKPTAESMRGTSTLDLARLRGVIECDLYRMQVPIARVHHATLYAYMTESVPADGVTKQMRRGQPNKADSVAAARAALPPEFIVNNDNEADAFWLLAMAMHHYVTPIVTPTPRRKTFVDKPDWPSWRRPGDGYFTIIAIDPSLSATGLAVLRTGGPLFLTTVRESPWFSYQGWEAPERHARISNRITKFVPATEGIQR